MSNPPPLPEEDPRPQTAVDEPVASPSLRTQIGNVAVASAVAMMVAQLVSVGQTVALARLLTPTEVGYFAAGSVVTAFISNFVEGGLRASLIQRRDRVDDAAETVFRATLAAGLLLSVLALVSAPLIGLIFSSHTAGVVAASMAGGILLFSLTNVPEALLQREFSVRRRLIVGPAVATTFAVVSVTLAASGLGVWSLVIGSYASSTVWVVLLWALTSWRPGHGKADLPLYREMVRFGLPLAISLFADQCVRGAQAIVTGRFLGVYNLGLFRYGDRIAEIPMSLIVQVGANSLFPAYSRIAAETERFRRAYMNAQGLLMVAAAAIAGLMVAIGQPLVVVVLGEEWRGAGVVLVTMAGLGIAASLATSMEAIKGVGRTSMINWVTLVETILGIGLAFWLAAVWGLAGVGLSITITYLTGGIMLFVFARPIVGLTWPQALRCVVPPLGAATVATIAVAYLETEFLRSDERTILVGVLLLVVDGIVYAGLYAVALRLIAPFSFHLASDVARAGLGKVRRLATRTSDEAPQTTPPDV